jgi:putative spermidine/putrescine transport system substrate-binding protein
MRKVRRRHVAHAAIAAVVGALAFAASGCGGGGNKSALGDWQVSGLGSTLAEIQSKAKDEGQVNLVEWAGYADKSWADEFTKETGCKVGRKDGATSDEMIDDISTGQYDGVSASGNASVRLMKRGDVAPINTDLIPNYADVAEGLKNQDYNSQNGHPYGVAHGRGWNVLAWRSDVVKPTPDSWSVVWNANNPNKGKISIYDDSIFIADAAVYLKATQPDLGIDNPYQLNEEQFNAAVDLLKTLKPNVGEWWGDYAKQIQSYANKDVVVGTTWPYQVNILKGDKKPVESTKPKEGTTGWSDTWMIYSKAAHPNCMYLWMNYIISPQANAKVDEWFGEAPSNPKACDYTADKNFCTDFHASDESFWKDIYFWTTPTADCGGQGGTCKTQQDWVNAWTEIRG